jgi:predicted PurR-regulated permease PerM
MIPGKASPRPKGLPVQLGEAEFRDLLANTARMAILFVALIVLIAALMYGRGLLLPVSLAIIVGLMFGPMADNLERRGIPAALSGAIIVFVLIAASILSFAVPLSEWVARAPLIWEKFRTAVTDLKEPLAALSGLGDQIKTLMGTGGAVEVAVADGNPVTDIAFLAPAILGEILVFLVSLYFYLATRENIRISILSLCVTRRLRWRTAHVFREVEAKVSRFLISVTLLNICVGIVMTLATWWLGLPSPILWGALAFILNYIPYVGQAIMIAILLAVGLGTQVGWFAILAPVGFYLVVNFVEGQVIFPQFVGRSVELNPFLIFLAILFWIWAWGPFGALVAVPSLLIAQSFLSHVLPSPVLSPRRPVRKTANMSQRDVILANAAKAIKEQAEDAAEVEAKAEEAKTAPEEPAAAPAKAESKPRRRTTKAKPATA